MVNKTKYLCFIPGNRVLLHISMEVMSIGPVVSGNSPQGARGVLPPSFSHTSVLVKNFQRPWTSMANNNATANLLSVLFTSWCLAKIGSWCCRMTCSLSETGTTIFGPLMCPVTCGILLNLDPKNVANISPHTRPG
jgi:hypothetical protein